MPNWIDSSDPRTPVAMVMLAIMLFMALVVMVLAIKVLIDGISGWAQIATVVLSVITAAAGVGNVMFRLQYLSESRAMVTFFSTRIDEIRSDIKESRNA